MRYQSLHRLLLLTALLTAIGCSSSANVTLQNQFPDALSEPKKIHATVVFNPAFSSYVATPAKDTTINLGSAQVELWKKAFRGLFSTVEFVTDPSQASGNSELIITPSVREVQIATPSGTYLNVYEVWIKYGLSIATPADGEIDNWFMPAYGKTPDAFMLSKGEAIEDAAHIALRDAGAKLLLDFYRIPAVYGWTVQRKPEAP